MHAQCGVLVGKRAWFLRRLGKDFLDGNYNNNPQEG